VIGIKFNFVMLAIHSTVVHFALHVTTEAELKPTWWAIANQNAGKKPQSIGTEYQILATEDMRL
jgi:hypothetical protein